MNQAEAIQLAKEDAERLNANHYVVEHPKGEFGSWSLYAWQGFFCSTYSPERAAIEVTSDGTTREVASREFRP